MRPILEPALAERPARASVPPWPLVWPAPTGVRSVITAGMSNSSDTVAMKSSQK